MRHFRLVIEMHTDALISAGALSYKWRVRELRSVWLICRGDFVSWRSHFWALPSRGSQSQRVRALVWACLTPAAAQLRTILADDTTFFVGTVGSASDDGAAVIGVEYYAPCFDRHTADRTHNATSGDLLFLALPVSQTWSHILSDRNKTVTVSVTSSANPDVVDLRHASLSAAGRQVWDPKRAYWRRELASKGRAVLYGKVAPIDTDRSTLAHLEQCFFAHHADAAYWAPGSRISPHRALWLRYNPEKIYYVGGFGDEHFIGWIDPYTYQDALPIGHADQQRGIGKDGQPPLYVA